YILGSSLFGARLAAVLGLPYAFASHFAPAELIDAVALYRREFRPSEQLEQPYVIAGLNVVIAEARSDAEAQFGAVRRARVKSMLARGRELSDDEAEALLSSPAGRHVAQMLTYAAVGEPREVRDYAERFTKLADADELIVVLQSSGSQARYRSLELFAESMSLRP
ncbi:MAG: LLM class flavin-dependent oxidoreductase, partial [Acidimicrobiales bacterium]